MVGIQISLNPFHALDYSGVGEIAPSKAIYIDSLVLIESVDGEKIATMAIGRRGEFGYL